MIREKYSNFLENFSRNTYSRVFHAFEYGYKRKFYSLEYGIVYGVVFFLSFVELRDDIEMFSSIFAYIFRRV